MDQVPQYHHYLNVEQTEVSIEPNGSKFLCDTSCLYSQKKCKVHNMSLLKKLGGYDTQHMSNLAFKLMSYALIIRDFLLPISKRLNSFGIDKGFTVVDFGCGPGSFVKQASQLVGEGGRVYAVDVHPLAIKSIEEMIKQKVLKNVLPVLSADYPVDIDSQSADIIYALDMFHHVKDDRSFLKEIHRILKPEGMLYIESGHQSKEGARQKIMDSNLWKIIRQEGSLFVCKPKPIERD